jgi:hypothetical protein
VIVCGVAAGAADVATAGSFPCRWNYDLHAGLRDGYVTAGANASCGGRSGSLTLTVRLYGWTSTTKRWRVDRAQTKTYANLNGNRYVEVAERCRLGKARADFVWILRSGGRVVARNVVHTAAIATAPGCRLVPR